jgi:hypothetical protein
MEVIFPCAGLSTRFPNVRPKYLLTSYNGRTMIEWAMEQYIGKHNVTIVILEEHNKQYNVYEKLRKLYRGDIGIVVLENPTSGPAETVFQGIVRNKALNLESPILIKDCDSFFDFEPLYDTNVVYVSNFKLNPNLKNICAKGYVISNEQNIITEIVEKSVVSDTFCCGGYQFKNSYMYKGYFNKLSGSFTKEFFISDMISYAIANGEVFLQQEVKNYIDVGTMPEWMEFNNKPTYICDIDGVIVKTFLCEYGEYEPITENIEALLDKISKGGRIIFVTARDKNQWYDITFNMLKEFGFEDFELIMNVNHSRRILINDFATTNPYPSAVAINIPRNANNLRDYL